MAPRTERSCSFKPLDEEGEGAKAKPPARTAPRLVLLPPRSAAASSGSSAQKPVMHKKRDGQAHVHCCGPACSTGRASGWAALLRCQEHQTKAHRWRAAHSDRGPCGPERWC
eukprot:scaffold22631_cov62-Phaeocystis_antarctica.AAC.3